MEEVNGTNYWLNSYYNYFWFWRSYAIVCVGMSVGCVVGMGLKDWDFNLRAKLKVNLFIADENVSISVFLCVRDIFILN